MVPAASWIFWVCSGEEYAAKQGSKRAALDCLNSGLTKLGLAKAERIAPRLHIIYIGIYRHLKKNNPRHLHAYRPSACTCVAVQVNRYCCSNLGPGEMEAGTLPQGAVACTCSWAGHSASRGLEKGEAGKGRAPAVFPQVQNRLWGQVRWLEGTRLEHL